ncbi:MAG: hypothetical protein ACKO96_21125, partial [Flammeovirgaceae bacterium]
YLKALGTGISGGLDRVEVGLNPLKLDNVAGEWQLWTAAIGSLTSPICVFRLLVPIKHLGD